MRSATLLARTRRSIPLCAILLCAGCVGAPPIVTTPNACSTLIPTSWRAPVKGADLPEGNTVADWVAFGDAQTGQLDKANGRTTDALDIIGRCEARDLATVKKARPRVFGVF